MEGDREFDVRIAGSPFMVTELGTEHVDDVHYKKRKQEIKKIIHGLSRSSSVWQVFTDWITFMALVISNTYDGCHLEGRMGMLKELDGRYNDDQGRDFLKMFIILGDMMSDALCQHDYHDFLGEFYTELGLTSKERAQVFTPDSISQFMGGIMAIETLEEEVQRKGYMTIVEPAAGSGKLVLGLMQAIEQRHHNPHTDCVILAVDTDIRCVYMSYIQLSLYGIPAVVQHGNSLSMEQWSRWYTPVYLLDMWVWREHMTLADEWNLEDERLKCYTQPMYGFMRYGFLTTQRNEA